MRARGYAKAIIEVEHQRKRTTDMQHSFTLSRTVLATLLIGLILAAGQSASFQRQSKGKEPVGNFNVVQADQRSSDPQYGRERNKDPMLEKLERDREKSLIKERHKALKRDTDRLLALATELKQYVDKTDENMLSLDVLKKSEEIEKLARSVKSKMKGY